MVYLRPPKKQGGYNIPKYTPLAMFREGIVRDWTRHALEAHDWGGYEVKGSGALLVLSCAECRGFGLKLRETERDTPELQEQLTNMLSNR